MKTSLLMGLATVAFTSSFAARADVVVGGGSAKYGYLVISGTPNSNTQNDATFTIYETTVGSHSEDSGEMDDKPLNQKIKLRTGEYRADYSNTHADFDIKEGQTTTIKLQKVIASALDNTANVELDRVKDRYDADDCEDFTVATWQRTNTTEVPTGQQQCSSTTSYGLFGIPTPSQSCEPGYREVTTNQSWKSAYFLVLPGEYSMIWTFADGTQHEEDNIVVK